MLRAINYCGLRMEYELAKKDIKNINIRIKRNGKIAVSAPKGISPKKVDSFVEKKADWIFQKLSDMEKLRESMPDDKFYDGKTLFFLGKEYKVRLVKGDDFSVELAEREIIIAYSDEEKLKEKYLHWLEEQAKPVFEGSITRMLELASDYNIKRPEMYIRNMTSRWGSCNKRTGRIGINVQLIKADEDCIDQVVLHELVHFVAFDHSERFYNVLSELMPDWRDRKKRLETQYTDGIA
ncbi:hypothetical protein IMSAG049_01341 [Clostridiales bacterium]|nr:hypothetical protein IMSAG049_01341 [Clostridiales bacterium]